MHITEIIVSAGRTVNHPTQSYANLKPGVTIKARLAEGDDTDACTKQLQAKAEQLVEDHTTALYDNLLAIERMSVARARVASLEQRLANTQQELDQARTAITGDEIPFEFHGIEQEEGYPIGVPGCGRSPEPETETQDPTPAS